MANFRTDPYRVFSEAYRNAEVHYAARDADRYLRRVVDSAKVVGVSEKDESTLRAAVRILTKIQTDTHAARVVKIIEKVTPETSSSSGVMKTETPNNSKKRNPGRLPNLEV